MKLDRNEVPCTFHYLSNLLQGRLLCASFVFVINLAVLHFVAFLLERKLALILYSLVYRYIFCEDFSAAKPGPIFAPCKQPSHAP